MSAAMETHEIIKDDNGGIIHNGLVLVRNKNTDELFWVPMEPAEETSLIQGEHENNEPSTSSTTTSIPSTLWSKENIKLLISFYAHFEDEFKSSKIKNEAVWKKIASELGCYTSKQCSDKFKYLKQKYIKKKDNMGPHDSGAASYKFEYFNEFDAIFGKKANVLPVAIATSLKGDTIQEKKDIKCEVENYTTTPPAKRKKVCKETSVVGKLLQHFQQESTIKEVNYQCQHDERLAAYDKMDVLLQKL